MSAEALINVRENYPFEVIQPAITPLAKSSPQRLMYAILTMIVVMFLGIAYVIGKELVTKFSQQLLIYSGVKNADNEAEKDGDEKSGWTE
jgi:hypothetical protein